MNQAKPVLVEHAKLYRTEWYVEPPEQEQTYVTLRDEWSNSFTVRHILVWEPVPPTTDK